MNFDNYVDWETLVVDLKKKTGQSFFYGKCHPDHNGLTRGGKLPYSISECEFNFMKDFIIKNKLTRGFELATGTCISTLALGYGFSKTGGKLISLYSYEEVETQNEPINSTGKVYKSLDYEMNSQLITSYNLEKFVDLIVGWSPKDSESKIDDIFDGNIDFVFFDCPKSKDDFLRDASILVQRVNKEKFAIFVHDTHCFMDDFNQIGQKMFGVKPIQIVDFETPKGKIRQVFPLSVITNIEF